MFLADQPSLFPHRKHCEWVEQGSVCDDGEVMMWHDTMTRETWLPGEQPPKRWQRYLRRHGFHGALGAVDTTEPGGCPVHPTHKPTPLSKVRRLQNSLRGLAKRVKDRAINVVADGLVGPHTVAATNRALANYAPGFTSGSNFTRPQIVKLAPQIAAYLEHAPYTLTHPEYASQQSTPFVTPAPPVVQPTGAQTMPAYYPPQPTYYAPPSYGPPGYGPPAYGPPRGPGGLPTDRASVDVRAFIPAQYEHVRVSPGTGMAVVAVGVVVALLLVREKKHSKKGD
jgi:hypothetical protein